MLPSPSFFNDIHCIEHIRGFRYAASPWGLVTNLTIFLGAKNQVGEDIDLFISILSLYNNSLLKKSETTEHKLLKEMIGKKLEEWFGVAITEYPSSGHELDAFSVTKSGITVMAEIIWTPSFTNFYRDLTLFLTSDAKVKILIVNPEIEKKEKFHREYAKVRLSELEKGTKVSQMLDGKRMLSDNQYLDDIRLMIMKMIEESQLIPIRENAFSNMDDSEYYGSKDLDTIKLASIKNMVDQYSHVDINMKIKFMAKFSLYSISNNLYMQKFFISFLIKEFKSTRDPHIILHCINILNNFVGVAKKNYDIFFIDILWNKIHTYLEKCFLSNDEPYVYSFFESQSIIAGFGERWTKEHLCKLYWSKLESQIQRNSTNADEMNRIYNCIRYYKKNCHLDNSQMKWILKEGENKELRQSLLNELI